MSCKRGGPTLNISIGKRKRTRTPITTKSSTNPSCGNIPKGTPSIVCGDIKLTTTHDVSSPSRPSARCPKPIPKYDDDDDFKNDASLELSSDIIIAIHSLKQNYSAATYNDPDQHTDHITFVLKTMVNFTLSTFSNDAKANQIASAMTSTGFDVELKRLCSSGELRLIQLQGLNGEEDEAIFEMQDYWKVVSNVRMQKTLSRSDQRVIDLFMQCVKKFPQTFVLEQELLEEMARENRKSQNEKYVLQKEDAWINCLISQQLLLPRSSFNTSISQSAREHRSYWFTLPKLGYCASLIKEGRRRMVNKLKRATYKEVKRSSLEVSSSARGGMSGPFHVRDLLARGVAKVKNTANGQFIKLQREEY